MNIFISYTLRDGSITKDYLLLVYQNLRKYGNVFIDLLHNNSKEPQKRIEVEIEKADIFILIATPRALKSEWVNFELEKAKSLCIPIVTVSKIDAFTMNAKSLSSIKNQAS